MHIYQKIKTIFFSFVLFVCSCSSGTATVIPQAIITSSPASIVVTSTLEAPSKFTATPIQKYNTPFSDYKGIPVMPAAFHGWNASDWYVFYINTSPDKVEKFYMEELESKGWAIYQYQTDIHTLYGEHGISLHFKNDNDNEVIHITFVVPAEAEYTLVTLAKFRLG